MEIYDFDFSDIIDKYSPDEVTIEDIINEIKNVSLDMVSGDKW